VPFAPTKAWKLTAGDGPKQLAVQFRDGAGNSSTVVSGTIGLDTVAPSATIRINNGAAGTASSGVTLTISATDPALGSGPAEMRFRNGATGAWSPWQPFAVNAPWTLTDGAGGKQVFVQVRDAAGNLSAEASDAITRIHR
jgi:hypothetical protein